MQMKESVQDDIYEISEEEQVPSEEREGWEIDTLACILK